MPGAGPARPRRETPQWCVPAAAQALTRGCFVHERRRRRVAGQGQDDQQVSRLATTRSSPPSGISATCRPRTARSIPDDDFAMIWEVDGRGAKRVSEIAKAVKGADKLILATDPDREGEAISWHVLEVLNAKKALKDIPVERVTFNAITKDAVQTAMRQSAPDRPGAGRRLSGPPRARLSRRLHPLAGAVAQAARRPLGRPRAVGGAAPRLRPRAARSRRFKPHEYWSLVATLATAGRRRLRGPPRRRRRQEDHRASTSATARRPRPSSATLETRDLHGGERRGQARQAPPARRPSPPRPCSRKPRASSAWRRPRPCRSRSGSMRASTSAARPSASSPICGPTASTWRPRPSRTRASVIGKEFGDALRAGRAAQLHHQGQERAGGPRGHPPDRYGPAAEAWSRAISSPSRPSSTS